MQGEETPPWRQAGQDAGERSRDPEIAQIHDRAREDGADQAASRRELIDGDDLRRSRVNAGTHEPDAPPGKACLSRQDPEGETVKCGTDGERQDGEHASFHAIGLSVRGEMMNAPVALSVI